MLVLSRKRDEKIRIRIPAGPAREISILVVGIHHGKVRLGIEAGAEVEIIREELTNQPNAA
jgi:carbon storage regulator CsrA